MGCGASKPLQLQRLSAIGDVEQVRKLLQDGVSPNFIDSRTDRYALHWASENGHCEIIDLLLEYGADINAEDGDKKTPLYVASESNHPNAVVALINAGADIKKKYFGYSLLIWEFRRGNEYTCKLLLDRGADMYEKDDLGKFPLHIAAELDFHEIIIFLCDKGANVNMIDRRGNTPLHYAVMKESSKTLGSVKLLMFSGANVNVPNMKGQTALDIAWEESRHHDRVCNEQIRVVLLEAMALNSAGTSSAVKQPDALKVPSGVSVADIMNQVEKAESSSDSSCSTDHKDCYLEDMLELELESIEKKKSMAALGKNPVTPASPPSKSVSSPYSSNSSLMSA